MSDSALAERAAFRELETVVRHLADELAAFRRRALTAEARVRDFEGREGATDAPSASTAERVAELEQENAALAARLEQATARARQMIERVRFLRQQAGNGSDK